MPQNYNRSQFDDLKFPLINLVVNLVHKFNQIDLSKLIKKPELISKFLADSDNLHGEFSEEEKPIIFFKQELLNFFKEINELNYSISPKQVSDIFLLGVTKEKCPDLEIFLKNPEAVGIFISLIESQRAKGDCQHDHQEVNKQASWLSFSNNSGVNDGGKIQDQMNLLKQGVSLAHKKYKSLSANIEEKSYKAQENKLNNQHLTKMLKEIFTAELDEQFARRYPVHISEENRKKSTVNRSFYVLPWDLDSSEMLPKLKQLYEEFGKKYLFNQLVNHLASGVFIEKISSHDSDLKYINSFFEREFGSHDYQLEDYKEICSLLIGSIHESIEKIKSTQEYFSGVINEIHSKDELTGKKECLDNDANELAKVVIIKKNKLAGKNIIHSQLLMLGEIDAFHEKVIVSLDKLQKSKQISYSEKDQIHDFFKNNIDNLKKYVKNFHGSKSGQQQFDMKFDQIRAICRKNLTVLSRLLDAVVYCFKKIGLLSENYQSFSEAKCSLFGQLVNEGQETFNAVKQQSLACVPVR